MKYTTIVCCLISVAIAGQNKQIQLEDIERDNLASEHAVKQVNGQSKLAASGGVQMQYGFVPMKIQPTFVPQTQQSQYQVQYQVQPQEVQPQGIQPQYYTSQDYNTQYVHQQSQPQQEVQQEQQQQAIQAPYFASKSDNLQYLIDNHLQSYLTHAQQQPQPQQQLRSQQQLQQHATAPQYVYVQPNQASSNNVHSIVDAKGNLQYYTYVPISQIAGSEFVQSDLTTAQTYSSVPQTVAPRGAALQQNSVQYVQYEQQSAKYPQVQQKEPVSPKYTNIQYYPQDNLQLQKQPMVQFEYPGKHQPQSLLESYVPSILQYQYYKEQQAKVQQQLKIAGLNAGKSASIKQAYAPVQQEVVSHVTYQHQLPSYQTHK